MLLTLPSNPTIVVCRPDTGEADVLFSSFGIRNYVLSYLANSFFGLCQYQENQTQRK